MTEVGERLKTELARLAVKERAELAFYLLQSLDGEADPAGEAAWDAELAKRAEEIQSGRAIGEPAEKVFAELRTKYA